jgi:non-ribosomal peptide synthase protein (TIGR01720 family)
MTDYLEQLQRLTPRQREAIAARLGAPSTGRKRLVAYIAGSTNVEAIEQQLAQQLPRHALPEAIIPLETLPKTPNGKIDRRKLTEPSSNTSSIPNQESPKSPLESQLSSIWAEVLQLPEVGIHDDFYRLGGDSILSIQVVSKAAQAGLTVSMKQFLEHRTIAELASALEDRPHSSPRTATDVSEKFGPVPLTPIQHWFFSCEFEKPQQWNQEILLELPSNITKSDLTKAFSELSRHYDSLRATFTRQGSEWTSTILEQPTGDIVSEASSLANAYQIHSELHLETAKLLKAVFLPKDQQLFIAAHHLAVDHVTWGVLLDGLATLLKGQPLPRVVTPFYSWASHLQTKPDSWQNEAPFWNRMLQGRGDLPLDGPDPTSTPTEAASKVHSQSLTPEQTAHLLSRTSEADCQLPEVLLTGILQSLDDWVGEETAWRFGIENHGRHPYEDYPDVSQTAGWFTAYHQVTFDRSSLPSVADRLREIPNHGLGFGILRYLAEPPALAATKDSQILFNYLGHHRNRSSLKRLEVDSGHARSSRNHRSHLLEINASILESRLFLDWHYSPAHLQPTSVEQLANGFEQAVTQLAATTQRRQFPLTPTQQSLLFHHLQEPDQDAGRLLVTFILEGKLDISRLELAWKQLIHRHEALRTTINWQSSEEEPCQQVHKESPFHLDKGDKFSASMDLDRLPTMRVSVEEIVSGHHRVHWLCHHIFLDGWSASLLCQELLLAYDDKALTLQEAPQFETYTRALATIPTGDSQAYWKAHLRNAPTVGTFSIPEDAPITRLTRLSSESSKALTTTAEELGVTVSTIVQVAWALSMARFRSTDSVVIGNAVSGRAVPLPDIQSLVGLCANTCPFHVRWTPTTKIGDLIVESHQAKLQGIPHEHVPLATIQDWLGLSPSEVLFECLLMIANYPQADADDRSLSITEFEGPITSVYPITLVVEPGESFALKWFCQSRWQTQLSWFQESFEASLEGCLADHSHLAGQLASSLPDPPAVEPSKAPSQSNRKDRPNDRTEDFISSLWQELFMIDDVDRDSAFRALGGSSLMAAKLTTRLGAAFQTRLPLDFVFKHPTIAKMASAMQHGEHSMTWPIVVPIRTEGPQPPLFVIHGLGGGVYDFFDWKAYLPEKHPIYGLQAPITPLENLEAIASSYVTEIKKVQPRGPYHFSSFCFGAAVGYEMAYQLEQQGETVAYFNVIDSILPSQSPSQGRYLRSMLRQSSVEELYQRFKHFLRRSIRLVTKGTFAAPRAADQEGYPLAYKATAETHTRALDAYKPKGALAGSIHLIRSQSQLAKVDPTLGWESLCEDLTVHVIACEHHEIFYSNHTAQITALVTEALMAK